MSQIEKVADRIWVVQAPLPFGTVCLYVIRGTKLAVIDTGYSFHPTESLAPALATLGLGLDEVDLILNTHGHPDHLGGNAALKDASGAHVHLHRADVGLAAEPEAHFHSPSDPLAAMRELGRDDQITDREAFLRVRIGRDVGVDRVLEEGDRVDLGAGMNVLVVHTPGHTAGSVTFLLERERLGFTGDAVQAWGSHAGALPLYCDAPSYIQSLKRLDELQLKMLCLGHPFRWSNDLVAASPVRTGDAVSQTLADSLRFVSMLERALNVERTNPTPDEKRIGDILRVLDPAFQVPRDAQGRVPASAALTVLAHLKASPLDLEV